MIFAWPVFGSRPGEVAFGAFSERLSSPQPWPLQIFPGARQAARKANTVQILR
jgi:hypothetical protein